MAIPSSSASPVWLAVGAVLLVGCTSSDGGVSGPSAGGAFHSAGGAGGASGGTQPSYSGGAPSSGGSPVPTGGASSGGVGGAGGTVASVDAGADADVGDASSMPDSSADGSDDGPTGVPVPPPEAVGCVTAAHLAPGVHQVTCDTTVHVLTVPERCVRVACGVIVDVHGGMMSSQMEDENTNLSALGVQHGYLVIQPNALINPLLLGQRLFVPDAPGAPADDTRVMNVLTNVMDAFHADTNRIHMTGFSEGGYMTWRWLCQHSDLLASVAPGAAAWGCANLANLGLTPPEIGCELTGTAVPARNIPVLYMHGTQDGLVDPACSSRWLTEKVLPGLRLGTGQEIEGDATFTRTRYLTPDGVPFEYISHQYTSTSSFLGVALAGHCYPGSADLTLTPPAETVIPPDQLMAFGCGGACSFDWGEEVMKFFMAHPKQ